MGDAYGGTNQTAVATDVRCNENHTRLDLCPITAISDAGSCDTRYSGPAGVICRGLLKAVVTMYNDIIVINHCFHRSCVWE